jgi:hypothetical protein
LGGTLDTQKEKFMMMTKLQQTGVAGKATPVCDFNKLSVKTYNKSIGLHLSSHLVFIPAGLLPSRCFLMSTKG